MTKTLPIDQGFVKKVASSAAPSDLSELFRTKKRAIPMLLIGPAAMLIGLAIGWLMA